ncbi:MAG: 1,4-alpha-glucan branching enzyme [Spirulina sp. SIO3F2]|nr:1,4-alpha-glucan branching enzyme [Spirulina sp. SIO3F2]
MISPEQVNKIVWNHHHDPFEVLGPHPLEQNGSVKSWVVRAYLPDAEQAWVLKPGDRQEHLMQAVHHPHFFECKLTTPELANYQLKVRKDGHDQVMYDPYAFRDPKLTDFDLHLFAEGNNHRIYEKMGAHTMTIDGVAGVYFAVWAPNARNVSIIGDFNNWDGRLHQMRKRGNGSWDLFIPEVKAGVHYKYEIKNWEGHMYQKADPYGFAHEVRPKTASIVADLDQYQWRDADWLERRRNEDQLKKPISVYELHLGSWLHEAMDYPAKYFRGVGPSIQANDEKQGARYLTYLEMAQRLIPYIKELGYTHIEMLPVAEHPYDGSWGYQVTGYYAPTARYGSPEDFMYFVDECHKNDIGVIVDWVPGHFPKDEHGLPFFDGTHLYEYEDPRIGEHKEWGTLVFNYGRNEVRNFLVSNVLFWFDKYHIDGIRVDAVASMLYRNYFRKDGEWTANEYGGHEHLEARDFICQFNSVLYEYYPGALSIAEESTDWPMVSWPTYVGGLGFNLKWNMGWMHDMLDYFNMDAWFRQFHQNSVTFSMWYNHSENYMLALSHDEVVHCKSSMIGKMQGDEWQKFAGVRTLFSYMFCHPGKKTMFMGMEFGQWDEWNVWNDLDWHLLQHEAHKQLKKFFSDLNALYKSEPALYELDYEERGFEWIDCSDNNNSVISFIRRAEKDGEYTITVCNFTPQPRGNYRIGVPEFGFYTEIFNSDAGQYGGSNMGNMGGKWADKDWGFHHKPHSIDVCLPPLGVVVFKIDRSKQPDVAVTAE